MRWASLRCRPTITSNLRSGTSIHFSNLSSIPPGTPTTPSLLIHPPPVKIILEITWRELRKCTAMEDSAHKYSALIVLIGHKQRLASFFETLIKLWNKSFCLVPVLEFQVYVDQVLHEFKSIHFLVFYIVNIHYKPLL